jgi:hypothetical protein
MSPSPDPDDGHLSTVPGIEQTINAQPWRDQGGHGTTLNRANSQPPEPSNHQGYQEWLLLVISGFAIFLAPIVIVSGMAASHGDNWKGAFFG